MTGRFVVATVVALILFATPAARAHNEYRIIGTVVRVTATSLEVKQQRDGKIISMQIDGESIVTRDKKKVGRAELKAGAAVAVDACGDSLKDLLVVEVRLLPGRQP